MNIDKNDVKNIAEGRIYGAKGLGFFYRLFNGTISIVSLATAIYFILINECSPFESIKSTIPPAIQHAAPWMYYLVIALIVISMLANTFLYNLLERRSRKIVEEWEKSGKLPERK